MSEHHPVEVGLMTGLSALGSAVAGFAWFYPATCSGGGPALPGYESVQVCTNIFGAEHAMLGQAQSVVFGGILGVGVGSIVAAYQWVTSRRERDAG